jgi:hypothetical protein
MRLLLLLVLLIGCASPKPADVLDAESRLPETVDYNYHVKPILSDRCFKCHGPDANKREAGLRLDIEEQAKAELPESPGTYAIVEGRPGRSQLFRRILSDDPDVHMPPPESNLTLSAEEKALLIRWIEEGAEYKPHWAFIPPEKTALPTVRDTAWVRNGIDAFILSRLERDGLTPASEASRETLIRRVTFDLTGLPPTLDELDDFLADQAPGAYERVVERLLASPAYGERMAAEWLDVSRYADSHGYQDDGMRNVWPWRDWVIQAFNENQPFDEFVTWQLAGDLLPNPSKTQLLATAFNRHHMQSQEGGIVPEEYRVEYVADRVQTVGTAFLGLTLQCSRCHDHKYDPVSQREFYQLFGFFNSVNEFGNIPYSGEAAPTVILPSREAEVELATLHAQMADVADGADPMNPAYDAGFARWVSALPTSADAEPRILLGHFPLDDLGPEKTSNRLRPDRPGSIEGDREKPPLLVDGHFDRAVELTGESWIELKDETYHFERNRPFSLSLWFKVLGDSVAGPLVGKSGGYFNGNRGYLTMLNEDHTLSASLNHVFPDNSIEVRTRNPVPSNEWVHFVFAYDGSSRAGGIRLFLNGSPAPTEVIVDNLHKSITYTYNFYRKERTNWGGAGELRIGMVDANQPRLEGVVFDEWRIYDSRLTLPEVRHLYGVDGALGALAKNTATLTDDERRELRTYYAERVEQRYRDAQAQLVELRGKENEIMTDQQEVMITRDQPTPRPTFVLNRGQYDAPTEEEVSPGTPAFLPAFAETMPANRLGLAQWLLSPDHPLLTRVTVNRFWQQYFGRGIVATPDDFGSQGELPSHPELLDWLAVTFRESGWDVRALQRLIVLSATYRQSSVALPTLVERDPENVLLARGPSYRMSAEMIRDNALAVSGLLVRTIGGPSVHPYQPDGLWEELATRNETSYKQDTGDNLYRRSMYTVWKRSTPPPSMISFDASERNFCTVLRQKTSTPLQALVLLNDPQYVEAARMLAERMIKEGGPTLDAQIAFAFRLLTSRRPEPSENEMLQALYEEERTAFEAAPADARALLAIGEYPRDRGLPAAEVAARTLVASTIMNYDEVYMKR